MRSALVIYEYLLQTISCKGFEGVNTEFFQCAVVSLKSILMTQLLLHSTTFVTIEGAT